MIKTFRGQIADGGQDTILLHTNDGSTGYRIVNFQIIPSAPGTVGQESITKIYKTSQASVDGIIDFSDNKLLGAHYYNANTAGGDLDYNTVIFDKEVFNQDIYVTHSDVQGSGAANYYIELEQVKLDLGENTVATLKDIRNVTAPG